MSMTVVGLFREYQEAEAVVHDLAKAGVPQSDISLVANDEHGRHREMIQGNDMLGTAAGSGVGTGAAIGGMAGLLLGLVALAIPGVGPIIAVGPLAAALTGAGIGAATGGMMGALSHMGVPEDEANFYAEGIRRGGALVTVRAQDAAEAERARDVINRHDVVDVEETTAPVTAVDNLTAPCELEAPEIRKHYERALASTGYTFDQSCAAYRYGGVLGTDSRFGKRNWDELENQIRRNWEVTNPGTWSVFEQAIRFAFDHARGGNKLAGSEPV